MQGRQSQGRTYAKEYSYDMKAQIYKWRHNDKKKLSEIAALLDTTHQRVSYILKTFDPNLFNPRKKFCGRSKKLNADQQDFLKQKAQENRFISGPKLANLLSDTLNVRVSARTANRSVASDMFQQHSARRVPLISPVNQKIRVEVAKEYLMKPKSFWNRVIWSDETKIELFRTEGKRWVWRFRGESLSPNCTVKKVKHGGVSTMLWGCMSASGVGNLVEITGTMTAAKYVQLLQDNLWVSAQNLGLGTNFVFQQDNDPKHTSKLAKRFFEENQIEVLRWAAQSPDLNVIEHMWAELKRRYGEMTASSKADMLSKLNQIWLQLGAEYARKLVDTIYDRCIAVIEMKGGATGK